MQKAWCKTTEISYEYLDICKSTFAKKLYLVIVLTLLDFSGINLRTNMVKRGKGKIDKLTSWKSK